LRGHASTAVIITATHIVFIDAVFAAFMSRSHAALSLVTKIVRNLEKLFIRVEGAVIDHVWIQEVAKVMPSLRNAVFDGGIMVATRWP